MEKNSVKQLKESDMTEILIEELHESLENGEELSDKLFKKMSLIIALDTHNEVRAINGRLKKVEAVAAQSQKYPSLLNLLHFSPRKTVVTIFGTLILTFLLLEVLWEYGLFPKFIEWFGLPPLVP